MKIPLLSIFALISAQLILIASDKDVLFSALGLNESNRAILARSIDLKNSKEGSDLYRRFVSFYEAQDGPIEFHNLEEISPSSLVYEFQFLEAYYLELIHDGGSRELFLEAVRKWKTQNLMTLMAKIGFIREWNETHEEDVMMNVLEEDILHAVEGERALFLSMREALLKEEDVQIRTFAENSNLSTELYDDVLKALKVKNYREILNLQRESQKRIDSMDVLNQVVYRYMWVDWSRFCKEVIGANKTGYDNSVTAPPSLRAYP